MKRFFLTIAMILALSSMAHAGVYIVTIGPTYVRDGSAVGDIVEIVEADEPPSGPGYANAEIIEIANVTKEDIKTAIETKKVNIVHDTKTGKMYWYDNTDTGNWYEIILMPHFELNLSALTIEDKATLASKETTEFDAFNLLMLKSADNISKYSINKQILKPEE